MAAARVAPLPDAKAVAGHRAAAAANAGGDAGPAAAAVAFPGGGYVSAIAAANAAAALGDGLAPMEAVALLHDGRPLHAHRALWIQEHGYDPVDASVWAAPVHNAVDMLAEQLRNGIAPIGAAVAPQPAPAAAPAAAAAAAAAAPKDLPKFLAETKPPAPVAVGVAAAEEQMAPEPVDPEFALVSALLAIGVPPSVEPATPPRTGSTVYVLKEYEALVRSAALGDAYDVKRMGVQNGVELQFWSKERAKDLDHSDLLRLAAARRAPSASSASASSASASASPAANPLYPPSKGTNAAAAVPPVAPALRARAAAAPLQRAAHAAVCG